MSTAASTSTRLLAATLGVLLAAVLGVMPQAYAQEAFAITIEPEIAGNTAVRAGQRISVAGSAPAGAITAARLIAVDAQGGRLFETVDPAKLNRTPSPILDNQDYLTNTSGQLDGRLTLGCLFASPTQACFHPETRQVILEITIGGATGESNAVRVDNARPQLRRDRLLIAPNRVLVRFTEPVRQPEGEIGADWRVNGNPVTAVEMSSGGHPDCVYEAAEDSSAGATGCTRILQLSESLGEDATPDVEYWLIGHNVPMRADYEDYADLRLLTTSQTPPIWPALDLIRPAAPNIESVDGKVGANGEILSNTRTPSIRLTNMTAGHLARVTVSGVGGTTDHEARVPDGANSVDVPVTLPADGSYTITAAATDINGNRSEETTKTAPRADGARQTVRYLVDSIVPVVLTATLKTRQTVEVLFSEPVVPAGNAGRWFVGDVPVTAEGTGDRRILRSAVNLDNPGPVRWEPTEETAQPGTVGRYGDNHGNGLAPVLGISLSDLPPIPAPVVTLPPNELYTKATSVTVAGTGPDQPNLVAELFERGSDTVVSSAPVSDGQWSIDTPLGADRRYEFEVRLRDTETLTTSPRVPVSDIVRDTTNPIVDVTFPDPKPPTLDNPTEQRRAYGIGSSVPITWSATDNAQPGDTERPDHGATADIIMVGADGARRAVAQGIPHQPGQEQTHSYTLTEADLAGAATRELRFEVAVTDLATNRGTDMSSPILLRADLIGYRAVLTEPTVVEAVFPVAISGETLPAEWLVGGTPAQQAQKTTRDGVTVVRLTVLQHDDPNPKGVFVQYQPLAVNPVPLRSAAGAAVVTEQVNLADGIAPALTVQVPNSGGRPIDSDGVVFSGTTDETANPNTIFAFRTDAAGAPQGSAIASATAGTNGQWSLSVPLTPNATNTLVVRASDPSGNVSARLPSPPFSVVEDSVAPVVQIISPKSASLVPPRLDIAWQTIDAHKEFVTIEYRVGDQPWQPIVDRVADTGKHTWDIPPAVQTEVFSLRVTATDQVGKTGAATADGLRLDVEAPTILKARASGGQVVDVTFSEPVTLDGSGFTVDGATVRTVKGEGETRTFILNKSLTTTTPQVEYTGSNVRDIAGNELENASIRATRAFAFSVTQLRGLRTTTQRVRITWADTRNRPADLRGYRIYRDGAPIGLVGSSTRAYVDRNGEGRHVYSVRAVDDRRRVSSVRRVPVR